MSDFDEHTRMWADEIVDGCYHDSHMYVGEGLWRCVQCGEVIRYIDDPNGYCRMDDMEAVVEAVWRWSGLNDE